MKEKLQKLIAELNKGLVGKEDIIKISLLTLLAEENLILIGPPGTAKSEIGRRLAQVIDDKNYFEYLLTKFTTPEEIFGPLSIENLKKDILKRNTEGYLPQSEIAFLDEIFKANSSILNSLLTIINEKKFHNGRMKEDTNLISLIGASNELPTNDDELRALYDRFLVRKVVDYIHDDSFHDLLDVSGDEFNIDKSLLLDLDVIETIRNGAKSVIISSEIKEILKEIKQEHNSLFKENKSEHLSDRRILKLVKLLKVSAFTNGRNQIDVSDLMLLKDCLWNDIDSVDKTTQLLTDTIKKNTNMIIPTPKVKTNQNVDYDFKGNGTESNPFLIEDENDFIHFATSDYAVGGYYFKQTKDLDFNNYEHMKMIEQFNGHYNGDDFALANIKLNYEVLNTNSNVSNTTLNFINGISNNLANFSNNKIGLFKIISENSSIYALKVDRIDINADLNTNKEIPIQCGLVVINNGKLYNIDIINEFMPLSTFNKEKHCISEFNGLFYENNGTINSINIKFIRPKYKIKSFNSTLPWLKKINFLGSVNNGYIENINISSTGDDNSNERLEELSFLLHSNSNTVKNCSIEVGGTLYSKRFCSLSIDNSGKIENVFITGEFQVYATGDKKHTYFNINNKNGKIKNCLYYNNHNYEMKTDEMTKFNQVVGLNCDEESICEKFFDRDLGWDMYTQWEWDDKEKIPTLRQFKIKSNITPSNDSIKLKANIFEENIWL